MTPVRKINFQKEDLKYLKGKLFGKWEILYFFFENRKSEIRPPSGLKSFRERLKTGLTY